MLRLLAITVILSVTGCSLLDGGEIGPIYDMTAEDCKRAKDVCPRGSVEVCQIRGKMARLSCMQSGDLGQILGRF